MAVALGATNKAITGRLLLNSARFQHRRLATVLTKDVLINCLNHEVQILPHQAWKVDPAKLDYRPTPKQRSTLELLQYMAIMGPTQIALIKAGTFNRTALSAAWSPAESAAKAMNFDQAVAA